MKIAVNLLPVRREIAGAGKYSQHILYELAKLDKQNQYYLFVSEHGKKNFEIKADNFHFFLTKINPEFIITRILWEQLIFPFKLRKLKPDIVFTPSVAIPLFYKGRFFTTIHDLAYKSKSKYSFIRRKYVKLITKISAKRSSVIFTVSNFSKAEIESEFKLHNKKVLITYNGVDEIFFKDYSSEELSAFRIKYNLKNNFILYVGAVEPSKNLDKLFRAYYELLRKTNFKPYIALTSGVGWNQEYLIVLLKNLKIDDKIIFLPYLPENELPLLYKCSKMLTYLSDYEGFGIPVLEAMAAQTPILTSRSEAIAEFAGKSVISVNPENIDEIVDGILKIMTDKDFVSCKIEEARETAKRFRWSSSAKIIYNEITLINT